MVYVWLLQHGCCRDQLGCTRTVHFDVMSDNSLPSNLHVLPEQLWHMCLMGQSGEFALDTLGRCTGESWGMFSSREARLELTIRSRIRGRCNLSDRCCNLSALRYKDLNVSPFKVSDTYTITVECVCAYLLKSTNVVIGMPASFRSIGRGAGVIELINDVEVALVPASIIITLVATVGSCVAISKFDGPGRVICGSDGTVCVVVSTAVLG